MTVTEELNQFEACLETLWRLKNPVAVVGKPDTRAASICQQIASLGVETVLFQSVASALEALHEDPADWSVVLIFEDRVVDADVQRSVFSAFDAISPSLPVISLSDNEAARSRRWILPNGTRSYGVVSAIAKAFDRKVEKIRLGGAGHAPYNRFAGSSN